MDPYRETTFEGEAQRLRERLQELEIKEQKKTRLYRKHAVLILVIAALILVNLAWVVGANTVRTSILGGLVTTAFFGFLAGMRLIFSWNNDDMNEEL